MNNMPKTKIGIVAVSRDCFPESLSVTRREALIKAYKEKYDPEDIYECPVCIVESEIHMVQALEDIKKAGCDALVVYLGNFGPEISETLLAKHFDGPKMFVAAAEESGDNLLDGRGDAYCGMLNASYNLKLRNIKAYIPEYPVGTAEECADMIHEFLPIARTVKALSELKIISFGPRPLNFLACNAPIKPLYDLARELDPQKRPCTLVSVQGTTADNDCSAKLSDVICLNRYYGWYFGGPDLEVSEEGLRKELTDWGKLGKPVIFTEYGADTVSGLHDTTSVMYTEEYQVEYYEMNNRVFDEFDYVVGEQAWNFADFATSQSLLRAQGNKKGLFTRDRKPKMVAHYFRNRWSNIPEFGYKK